MPLDPNVVEEVLDLAKSRQYEYSADGFSPEKFAAKKRAAKLIAGVGYEGPALDLGGESFYVQEFRDAGIYLEQRNLPEGDVHELVDVQAWGCIIAMHVLEHSPFPLYVLALIRRALRPGGLLYVAVPKPRRKWTTHSAHFSVLAPAAWHRLLGDAGFELIHRERGKFGPRSKEERILARRPA